eukprot:2686939-Alexandrium_andersonii.AAC.1
MSASLVGSEMCIRDSFVQEQPHPSSLYKVTPWPSVMRDECVVGIVHDRCMCGLRATSGQGRGKHIRKRSSMTASCTELPYPFRGRKCSGRHKHLVVEGRQADLRQAQ